MRGVIIVITKESFRDWKADPVTKAVFDALLENVSTLHDELGNSAGLDALSDRYKCGYIMAIRDTLAISIDEVADGN